MYTDQWLKVTDEDGNQVWYYFGSTGKAIKDNWKKIDDKWYHFDSDGRMETGWIEDDMYYCNASGEMLTGWQQLYSPDDEEENSVTPGMDSLGYGDGKNWYYFSPTGKKYLPDEDESGDDYGARKIEGYYYCFDEEGAMQTGWKEVRNEGSDTILNYMYFGEDGKGKIGWYSMYPPEELGGYDGDVEWFYFTNSGEPRASESERLEEDDIVRINGKKYLFNDLGNPVYGLKKVYINDDEWTAFYFGDKETSSVQTGKMSVTEGDGTKSDFYFSSSGRGYTGVRDGYLYYAGKKQEAVDGIYLLATVVPLIMFALMLLLMILYPLGKRRDGEMRARLAALRACAESCGGGSRDGATERTEAEEPGTDVAGQADSIRRTAGEEPDGVFPPVGGARAAGGADGEEV